MSANIMQGDRNRVANRIDETAGRLYRDGKEEEAERVHADAKAIREGKDDTTVRLALETERDNGIIGRILAWGDSL